MKTWLKSCLILGFVLTGSAAETSPVLTIHVTNQAEVDRSTLFQAEKTATAIFKKTGVATQWIDPPDEESFPLSHIHLKILPSVMSIRPGLPDNFRDNAIGLAPGSGPNRQWAYVFYNSVEALALSHRSDAHANTAKILGTPSRTRSVTCCWTCRPTPLPASCVATGISRICGTPAMDLCFSRRGRQKQLGKR